MQDETKTRQQLLNELAKLRQQIIQQKQLDSKLILFKNIIDNSSEAIAISDPAGNLIYINAAHQKLFERSLEEVPKLNYRTYYPAKSVEILDREVVPALAKGESWQGELDAFDAKGHRFYLWGHADSICDHDGNILYCFGIMHDVTRRKKAEEALRYSNRIAHLRSDILNILATAEDSEMYFQVLDILLDFFQSKFGFFGYIDEQGALVCPSMTKDIWEQCQMENKTIVFPPQVWGGLWGKVLLEKKSFYKNDAHKVPKGHIPLYRSMGVPILNQGELIGSIHLANRDRDYEQGDIHVLGNIVSFIAPVLHARQQRDREEKERQNIELQLRQAQKMEAIGTLAGGIAHDFNNILATMLGYTELLLEQKPEPSEERKYLEHVYRAGLRAANLVNQILTFSRVEKRELEPLKITPLVKEALNMLRASLPTTIEIRQDIVADCPPILANATQLHQVLLNLCANASHAMKDKGGILTVSLEEVAHDSAQHPMLELASGTYLKLNVSDTGCGMTADVRERIFDPFFTTKQADEGTGLGLSVVHGIVKSHQGAITLDSVPGKGTTFQLFFPTVEDIPFPEKPEIIAGDKGSEHILIAEDESALAMFYETLLSTLGYQVIIAENGQEALEIFRAQPDRFDLVFTDQTMPKMTGAQLSEELLKIRPNLPIILATGYSGAISETEAKAIGIRHFLIKPVKAGTLAKLMREVLEIQV